MECNVSANANESNFADNSSEDCVGGSSESSNTYELFLLVLTAVNTPLCVLGIVGNLLSLGVLMRKSLPRSSMFFFLKALNVCDTIVLLASACVILSICKLQNSYVASDEPGGYIKWMNLFVLSSLLYYASTSTSTMLVMLISLERWIAVCKSMTVHHICTPRRVKCAVLLAVLLSVLLVLPRVGEVRCDVFSKYTDMVGMRFAYDGFDKVYLIGYRITLYSVASFLLPLLLIIMCNAHLITVIRQAYRQSLTLSLGLQRRLTLEHESSFLASWCGKLRRLTFGPAAAFTPTRYLNSGGPLSFRNALRPHSAHIYQIAEHKVAVVGMCVVVVFCVSAVPSLIIELYESYELLMEQHFKMVASTITHYLAMLSKLLMTVNCTVNVAIYSLCTAQFRNLLKRKHRNRTDYRCSWQFGQQHHHAAAPSHSLFEQDGAVRISLIRTDTARTVSSLLP